MWGSTRGFLSVGKAGGGVGDEGGIGGGPEGEEGGRVVDVERMGRKSVVEGRGRLRGIGQLRYPKEDEEVGMEGFTVRRKQSRIHTQHERVRERGEHPCRSPVRVGREVMKKGERSTGKW